MSVAIAINKRVSFQTEEKEERLQREMNEVHEKNSQKKC